ncbi:MAG TPA: prolyl oligopeptidase family serine peptidase, partial [Solirubrobacterales bacterium]|nr:prolyl oligopeptidase family serine peptidase [Solirubrobacterales bacterium]
MAEVAPYGSWRSPIEPDVIAKGGRRLGFPALAADGAVWWLEGRAAEGGRSALMRRPAGGEPEEVTPPGANVRTRVHEYGGGAWKLLAPELVVYVDFADQRVYRLELGGEPVAITPEPEEPAGMRYADFELCPDGKTLFCVRELHGGDAEPRNEIVMLPLDGSKPAEVVAAGHDFYSSPRVSPDGLWLAFLCWDHPNMPWDGTELWVTPVRDPGSARPLAAGKGESVFAPAWDGHDRLRFVSDRDGWWNLYRTVADFGAPDAAEDLPPVEQLSAERADLGHPQWLFGGSTHVELDDGSLVVVRTENATEQLYALPAGGGALRDLGLPFTSFGWPVLSVHGGKVAFAASSPTDAPAIVVLDVASGETETVRTASDDTVEPGLISEPRAIEFPSGDGDVAHAFYYPPTNADFEGPEGERPPLIVISHGGPTSHATPELSEEYLFWTSRGFGVADVNYRGSSGYGRAYRDKLQGTWGIVDTEDCVAAARFLAETGEVDGERLAIRGGSAGGYATLCALVFHDAFAAGASYYGVADTETLARDTHKFEARYLDGLIGPYPERADLYRERSPIHFVERLKASVILFQGLEDKIVPPNQAETMVAAMKANGVPHAYLA